MCTLHVGTSGEVHLTLRGEEENRILATVRHWPHWRRVDIEHDTDTKRCIAVTLVTDQAYEPTVREILKRSFRMTFPPTGGSMELEVEPETRSRRRSRY